MLALLTVAVTITAACLGTFPDVTIGSGNLNSLDQPNLETTVSKGGEMPGREDARLLGAPSDSFKEGLAADVSGPLAETSEKTDQSVFERLNPDGPKLLDPREYDQRLPLDAIRPIYEPLVGSPDEVQLDADELVMGVSINGESRAYPISVLRFREMVNDELGGTPILVTW